MYNATLFSVASNFLFNCMHFASRWLSITFSFSLKLLCFCKRLPCTVNHHLFAFEVVKSERLKAHYRNPLHDYNSYTKAKETREVCMKNCVRKSQTAADKDECGHHLNHCLHGNNQNKSRDERGHGSCKNTKEKH